MKAAYFYLLRYWATKRVMVGYGMMWSIVYKYLIIQ